MPQCVGRYAVHGAAEELSEYVAEEIGTTPFVDVYCLTVSTVQRASAFHIVYKSSTQHLVETQRLKASTEVGDRLRIAQRHHIAVSQRSRHGAEVSGGVSPAGCVLRGDPEHLNLT